jgi:GAF domain-containing protein
METEARVDLEESKTGASGERMLGIPAETARRLLSAGVPPRELSESLLPVLEDDNPEGKEKSLLRIVERMSKAGFTPGDVVDVFRVLVHRWASERSLNAQDVENAVLKLTRLFLQGYLEREKEGKLIGEGFWSRLEVFPSTIAAVMDPGTLIREGLDAAREITGADAAVYLQRGDGGRWRVLGTSPRGDEGKAVLMEARGLQEESGIPTAGVSAGDSVGEEASTFSGSTVKPRLISILLGRRGGLQGRLVLWRRKESQPFSEEDETAAEIFSRRFMDALENSVLHRKEQEKIKEVVSLLEISRLIGSTLDLKDILSKVAAVTVDLSGAASCVVYLEADGLFRPVVVCGDGPGRECAEGRRTPLLPAVSKTDLPPEAVKELERGHRFELVLPDGSKLALPGTETAGRRALLFPLTARGELKGLFALHYPPDSPPRDKAEVELLAAVASQASLAIENEFLYRDIEKSYFSTVKALARAIEVKDPYTHGHSERVTEYALRIAEAMGLDEAEKQKLKYAATLHDIGKIGIAGKVLNKPAALTEEEYLHVKTHPLLGDSIIEPVEFLQAPRPLILHHHERFDGKGYPDGLSGEDIPLGARILAVADAYDAMRSDRPYRKALTRQEAKRELMRNAGTQFDPRVVEVFLRVLEEEGLDEDGAGGEEGGIASTARRGSMPGDGTAGEGRSGGG